MSILSDAINRLLGNESKLNDIVNGDSQTTVQTGGGLLPSLAKLLKDKGDKIDAFIPSLDAKQDLALKDKDGGYPSIGTQRKIAVQNFNGSVTGWLTALFTRERTLKLPDRDGVLATTDQLIDAETKETLLAKLGATAVTGNNTGDQTLESLGAQPKLGFVPLDVRVVGIEGGVTPLDENGLVDPKYLPDTIKAIVRYANFNAFPLIGDETKLYIDETTGLGYFWVDENDRYQGMGANIQDTDSLTEGENNLFFTIDRVLQVTLSGFNIVNKIGTMNPADTIIDALGKAQYQLIAHDTKFNDYATKADPTLTGDVTIPTVDTTNDSPLAVNVTALKQAISSALFSINTAVVGKEDFANKAYDFNILDDNKYPTAKAVAAYVTARTSNAIRDRGQWDPTATNNFPTTGGTGLNGAIELGNLWYISVAGFVNGVAVDKGDTIRALADNPGQDQTKWAIAETNFGYVPAMKDGGNATGTWNINTTGTVKVIDSGDVGGTYYPTFVNGRTGQRQLMTDLQFSYDPSTNTLTVPSLISTGDAQVNGNLNVTKDIVNNGAVTSSGAVGNNGGILTLIRDTFPQWILKVAGAAANLGRFAGWLESDGTLSMGPQDDAGTGTRVMSLGRKGGTNQWWNPAHVFRNNTTGTETNVQIDGYAGQMRRLTFSSNNVARWQLHCDDNNEVGSNVGSNFGIAAYSDTGVLQGYLFTISRSTGKAAFQYQPRIFDSIPTTDNSQGAVTSQWVKALFGIANGIASLGADGKIPASMLPGYVDDVIEVDSYAFLPQTGESGKLYVTANDSKTFRWSGTTYAPIIASPGTTDAITEGTNNLFFTVGRAIAAPLTGLVTSVSAVIGSGDTILQALGKLQAQINAILASIASTPFDLGGGFNGKPGANEVSMVFIAIRKMTIPQDVSLAKGYANTAPTNGYVVSLTKNGTQFATLTWAAGASAPTIVNTAGAAISIVAGDIIRAVAPAAVDPTAADITFTFPSTLG